MSFNLAELQQKVDRVIHNADEFIRKWIEFISAPAGDVSIEYYDKNGQLRTNTFANRNKLIQDFIANANAVMAKTVYVDQINGNDGNDGSQNAPFKTLPKAMNSVPVGGRAEIRLLSDYVSDWGMNFSIFNKYITLNLSNKTLRIQPTVWDRSSQNLPNLNVPHRISVRGGSLRIVGGTIQLSDNPADSSLSWAGGVQGGAFATEQEGGQIIFQTCTISIPQQYGGSLVAVSGNFASVVFFSDCNITIDNTKLIELVGSCPAALRFGDLSKFRKSDGTQVDIRNVLIGIIRDSNGTPRNVISNVIL